MIYLLLCNLINVLFYRSTIYLNVKSETTPIGGYHVERHELLANASASIVRIRANTWRHLIYHFYASYTKRSVHFDLQTSKYVLAVRLQTQSPTKILVVTCVL